MPRPRTLKTGRAEQDCAPARHSLIFGWPPISPLRQTAPHASVEVLLPMNVRSLCLLAALALAGLLPAYADDPADQWIAKARAACGPEAALNAITSVHYFGTLVATEKVAS